jgi:hypothetical protein
MVLGLLTLWALGLIKQKVDSLLNITESHFFSVQLQYFLQKANLFLIIFAVSRGFLAAQRDGRASLFWQMN